MVLKKNVNGILLLLLIILAVAFAGFSVVYQLSFENVTTEYDQKMGQLEKVQSDLLTHKEKLEETEYELEVKAGKEEDLSTKYGDIKSERDTLASDKSKLEVTTSYRLVALIPKAL